MVTKRNLAARGKGAPLRERAIFRQIKAANRSHSGAIPSIWQRRAGGKGPFSKWSDFCHGLLGHAGKVSAEAARLKAEAEYGTYRRQVDQVPTAVARDMTKAREAAVDKLPKPSVIIELQKAEWPYGDTLPPAAHLNDAPRRRSRWRKQQ